jgi:hypothetical protein
MQVTIRHHFDFGADRELVGEDLVTPESWDALRTQTSGPFAAAASREELAQVAEGRPELGDRAREIDHWLEANGIGTLASYGVGGGTLEWWLQRLQPDRRLLRADYAPATVERLGELFPDAEVHRHNLLADPPLQADAHLFHRVDTELTNAEWHEAMRRFAAERVLVVATEVATPRRLLYELLLRLRRRHLSRAGWLRTRGAFEALWRETHDARPLRLQDLDGWALTPRQVQPGNVPARTGKTVA